MEAARLAGVDSPPESDYDHLPEAVAHQPGDAYRYDPNPGQRFTE